MQAQEGKAPDNRNKSFVPMSGANQFKAFARGVPQHQIPTDDITKSGTVAPPPSRDEDEARREAEAIERSKVCKDDDKTLQRGEPCFLLNSVSLTFLHPQTVRDRLLASCGRKFCSVHYVKELGLSAILRANHTQRFVSAESALG